MKLPIDYEDFLSKRFDLVVRYHILREVDFDFDAASYAVVNSDKYRDLREAYKKLALPIAAKMKASRLWKMHKDRLDLFMAHNLFFVKNYHWIEQAMKTDYWQYAEPYGVRSDGQGVPTKRFLVALKLGIPLLWQQGGWLDSYKMTPRPTRPKQNYKKLLPKNMFRMFEQTEKEMMAHMRKLNFFSLDCAVDMPMIEYKIFLNKRFDFVIRYLLLEQSDFDVRKARQLWEVKIEKGKPVVIDDASNAYDYLDKLLKGKLFFDQLKNWDYIDRKLKADKDWLRFHPYILTTHSIGISIKRFFVAIKYERPLYWFHTDVYTHKYTDRLRYAPWHIDLYNKNFSKTELEPFKQAKFRLMAKMSKLGFFCRKTKVGGLTNEYLSLCDISNR